MILNMPCRDEGLLQSASHTSNDKISYSKAYRDRQSFSGKRQPFRRDARFKQVRTAKTRKSVIPDGKLSYEMRGINVS